MTLYSDVDKDIQQEPTISLCMIVKNEEEFLGRCLESIKDVVHEIIVVDTGSTDKSVEIAEGYGAKVYHHPWEGNFSKARNMSLQYATCEWILILDADEELEREDIPAIQNVLKNPRYDIIYCVVLNDSPEGWSKHYSYRFFRRGKAHYEGIVHNQLVCSGTDVLTEIRVYHYGYNLSKGIMDIKFKRTEELLLKQISEDQTDPFAHWNYLRILRVQRRFEEGVKEGRKALIVCRERMLPNHLLMITFDTANCLMATNRAEEAEMLCREVLKDYPNDMNILFVLGESLRKQNRHQEAIEIYQRFLKVKEKNFNLDPRLIYDTFNFEHKAWMNISDCYFGLGDLENSTVAAEKAVALRPDRSVYKIFLSRILAEKQQIEKAKEILNRENKNNPDDVNFYIKWAKLCIEYPLLGSPVEKIKLGLSRYPESEKLNNELAYAVHQSDKETAEKTWAKVLKLNPTHIGAHAGLIKIYGKDGRHENIEKHAKVILEKCNQKMLLKEVGTFCLNVQLYTLAIDLLGKYLEMESNDAEALSDIATCYAQMGHYEASFIGYKEALRLDPQNSVVLEKMRELQRLMQQVKDGDLS